MRLPPVAPVLLAALLWPAAGPAQGATRLAREVLAEMVSQRTTTEGSTTPLAESLAARFRAAGFPAEDVLRLGAHGYTIVDARGGGRNGVRDALWDADRCIRMEILCDPHTCEGLVEHLQKTYFAHYSISLYVCEVGVLRPEKYAA